MRLLHTTTQKLVEKTLEELRKENLRYAILSHTWGQNEVIYDDILHGTEWTKNPSSLSKVQGACRQARSNGYDYIWIDTCCIDKSSSSELSEAINSMFSWYESGDVCYAFIEDFNYESLGSPEKKASFASSRWFTRGWTLQEASCPPEPPCRPPDGTPTAGSRKNGTGPKRLKRLSPPHGHGSPNQPVRVAPSPSPPKPAKWHPVAPVCGAW